MLGIVQRLIGKRHGSSTNDCAERAAVFDYDDEWRNFIERQADERSSTALWFPPVYGVIAYIFFASIYALAKLPSRDVKKFGGFWDAFLEFVSTAQIGFTEWLQLFFGVIAFLVAFVTFPSMTRWNRDRADDVVRRAVTEVLEAFRVKRCSGAADGPLELKGAVESVSHELVLCGSRRDRGWCGVQDPTLRPPVIVSTTFLMALTLGVLGASADAQEVAASAGGHANLGKLFVILCGVALVAFLPTIFSRYTDAMSDIPHYVKSLYTNASDVERCLTIALEKPSFEVENHLRSDVNCFNNQVKYSMPERVLHRAYRHPWISGALGLFATIVALVILRIRVGSFQGHVGLIVATVVVVSLAAFFSALSGAHDIVQLVTDRISGREIKLWNYPSAILAIAITSTFVILVFIGLGYQAGMWELAVAPVALAWAILVLVLWCKLPGSVDKRLAERFTKAAESITAILEYHATRENEVHMTKASPRKGNAR